MLGLLHYRRCVLQGYDIGFKIARESGHCEGSGMGAVEGHCCVGVRWGAGETLLHTGGWWEFGNPGPFGRLMRGWEPWCVGVSWGVRNPGARDV